MDTIQPTPPPSSGLALHPSPSTDSLVSLNDADKVAVVDVSPLSIPELEALDADMLRAIDLFFDNNTDGALAVIRVRARQDALYALGEGIFSMIKAMTTFDMDHIATAADLLNHAEALAAAQLKLAAAAAAAATSSSSSSKLGGWFKGGAAMLGLGSAAAAPPLTPAQLRSTVIRAESSLIASFLYLFQESVMAFVRAGLGIRKSQNNYATAWKEYQARVAAVVAAGNGPSSPREALDRSMDQDTREGVQFGIGSLNVILSILPSKVSRLISILGYAGDKHLGFALLEEATVSTGVRAPIATLFMGGYHAVLSSFAPSVLGPTMLPIAARHLTHALTRYPHSLFHLLLTARAARTARALATSDALLHRALSRATSAWPEIARVLEFEACMNAMVRLDWPEALRIARDLQARTYWSPAFFAYTVAVCAAMAGAEHDTEVRKRLAACPDLVVRKFGGKVISVEQWVVKKCGVWKDRDATVGEWVPGLEILLIWNLFGCMPVPTLTAAYAKIVDALDRAASAEDPDALVVLYCILGAVEKERRDWAAATRALESIAEIEDQVKVETWVPPLAAYLRGVVALGQAVDENRQGAELRDAVETAKTWMGKAGKYSDFCFEYRLAFRIHLVTIQLNEWLGAETLAAEMMRMPDAKDLFGDLVHETDA
ncbi:hypothetical protein BC828DRAFT_382876 [Blastocladiella britannica]|nr:hypothetical protein BC828DRAFT_382876 [Blastocladiella britannica]